MEGFVYDDDSGIPPEPRERADGNHEDDSDMTGPGWKVITAAMLVVAAGLAGLALYAQHWKKNLWVREVVFSGNRLLSGEELLRQTDGLVGKDFENIDSSELVGSYAALPYIKRAGVAKELNGIVRVTVEERIPMARVISGDKVEVIDTEGYILPYRDLPLPAASLPRVAGVKKRHVKGENLGKAEERGFAVLREMIEAVAASEYARLLISDVNLKEENETYFTAAGSPTRFIVGNDGNYKEKLKKFEIFWQKVVAKKGLDGYATVDLRFAKRVFAVEKSR